MSNKENEVVQETANEARAEKNLPPITLQEIINNTKTDDDIDHRRD